MISENAKNELKNTLKSLFQGPIESCNSVQAFVLATTDGHTVAKYTRREIADSRVSAMCSSSIGLADKLAMEVGQKQCEFAILHNSEGYVIMKKLKANFVLILAATQSDTLGTLLNLAKTLAKELNESLP